MESTLSRAHIVESEEQSMARFLNGLTYPIKRIVEFLPYENLVELVHQAMKAERQVVDELKYVKAKSFFATRASSSTQPMTQVHAQGNVKGSTPQPQPPPRIRRPHPKPPSHISLATSVEVKGTSHLSAPIRR